MSYPKDTIAVWSQQGGTAHTYDGWKIRYPDGRITQLKVTPGEQQSTYDFDRVVRATGVQHWIRKGGYWIPDPKGTSTKRPCCKRVSNNEMWTRWWPCDKPIKEDGRCGIHLRQIAQRQAASQAYEDERNRSDAGKRIAADAVEALAQRGVKSQINYVSGFRASDFSGYDGKVNVHAEDVLALLRRVSHLEEQLGLDPAESL